MGKGVFVKVGVQVGERVIVMVGINVGVTVFVAVGGMGVGVGVSAPSVQPARRRVRNRRSSLVLVIYSLVGGRPQGPPLRIVCLLRAR